MANRLLLHRAERGTCGGPREARATIQFETCGSDRISRMAIRSSRPSATGGVSRRAPRGRGWAATRLREAAGIKCRLELRSDRHRDARRARAAAQRPSHPAFPAGGPFAILPPPGNAPASLVGGRCSRREILAYDDEAFLAEVDKRFAGRYGRLQLPVEGPHGH